MKPARVRSRAVAAIEQRGKRGLEVRSRRHHGMVTAVARTSAGDGGKLLCMDPDSFRASFPAWPLISLSFP